MIFHIVYYAESLTQELDETDEKYPLDTKYFRLMF